MACSACSEKTRSSISRAIGRTVSKWRRWRTEREIEAMPYEIRKDIGWPDAFDR